METTAAARRAKEAVEGVDSAAGAPLPIGVVAYTRLKLKVELL